MQRKLPVAAFLASWALAAGAPPAAARAPSSTEEGCLDFIVQKLKDDREEDLHPRVPIEDLKINAYQTGESALDDWRPVAEIILDKEKKAPQARRDRATSALSRSLSIPASSTPMTASACSGGTGFSPRPVRAAATPA